MSEIIFIQNKDAMVIIPPEHLAEFKELVRRGSNTWEHRSPEMRKFTEEVSGLSKIMNKPIPFCLACTDTTDCPQHS